MKLLKYMIPKTITGYTLLLNSIATLPITNIGLGKNEKAKTLDVSLTLRLLFLIMSDKYFALLGSPLIILTIKKFIYLNLKMHFRLSKYL